MLGSGTIRHYTQGAEYKNWKKLKPAVDSFQNSGAKGKEKDETKALRGVEGKVPRKLKKTLRLEIFSHSHRAVGGGGEGFTFCSVHFQTVKATGLRLNLIHYEKVQKVRGVER